MLLFLTFYMQSDLGFSALTDGLAFLPMSVTIAVTSMTVQTRVLPSTGAKPIFTTGMALGALAMILLTRLSTHGAYLGDLLPALIVFGMGMGCILGTGFATATLGVAPNEAGVAAALVNTSQQIGGSVGTAVLSTAFASAAASYATAHGHLARTSNVAAAHGYTTTFTWGAGAFVLGLIAVLLILPGPPRLRPRSVGSAASEAAARTSAAAAQTAD